MAGVVQIFTRRGTTRRPVFNLAAEGGRFGTARGAMIAFDTFAEPHSGHASSPRFSCRS